MSKANLLLKNDVGPVLDITESPLGCTVYDLEGNQIGGGGGGDIAVQYCDLTIVNNTGSSQYPAFPCLDADGYINNMLTVTTGQTVNVKVLYILSHGSAMMELDGLDNVTLTLSNAVNCELNSVRITRTAEGPSSATLTLS